MSSRELSDDVTTIRSTECEMAVPPAPPPPPSFPSKFFILVHLFLVSQEGPEHAWLPFFSLGSESFSTPTGRKGIQRTNCASENLRARRNLTQAFVQWGGGGVKSPTRQTKLRERAEATAFSDVFGKKCLMTSSCASLADLA